MMFCGHDPFVFLAEVSARHQAFEELTTDGDFSISWVNATV